MLLWLKCYAFDQCQATSCAGNPATHPAACRVMTALTAAAALAAAVQLALPMYIQVRDVHSQAWRCFLPTCTRACQGQRHIQEQRFVAWVPEPGAPTSSVAIAAARARARHACMTHSHQHCESYEPRALQSDFALSASLQRYKRQQERIRPAYLSSFCHRFR